MAAERPQPIVVVSAADGTVSTDEIGPGPSGTRRGWWLIAAIAGILLIGALAVNSGAPDSDEEIAGDDLAVAEGEAASDASQSESDVVESAPSNESRDGIGVGAEVGATEQEQPIEPYIPSRVRSNEPGPPAEICTGGSDRVQLPLAAASRKADGVDQLVWSPDCRRMVFRVGNSMWVANGDGTSDMPFLTSQHGMSSPAWSPDSGRIAFSQSARVIGERASHIHLVAPDARGLAQITGAAVFDQRPSWSPDGTRIVFSRREQVESADSDAQKFDEYLFIVDPNDKSVRVNVSSGGDHETAPAWSPDGEWIAYTSGNAIWLVRPDGTDARAVTQTVPAAGASWSPDGTRLAAVREWRTGGAALVIVSLGTPDSLDDPDETVLLVDAPGAASAAPPALQWTTDGRHLIFHKPDDDGRHWAYSVDVP